jgi:hypothetical protein
VHDSATSCYDLDVTQLIHMKTLGWFAAQINKIDKASRISKEIGQKKVP